MQEGDTAASGLFVFRVFPCFSPVIPFIRAVADEIESKIVDQEHQVLECEELGYFVYGIAYRKDKETAPDQAVPLPIVVDQDINDQQDVFQHIVQRAVEGIHGAVCDDILVDQADHRSEDRQYQGSVFLL